MISTRKRNIRSALSLGLIAPFMLAACNSAAEDGGTEAGEAIAAIPAPEGASWTETVTVSPEDGYVLGNPDAPIKLLEFASHTCGACANFSQNGKAPLKEYVETGVVSFEQRNLVRDPIDLTIATLVRCGQKENMQVLSDQAWGSLNDIFGSVQQNAAQYEASGELPIEQRFVAIAEAAGLIEFFSARGLSADQARACLSDTATIETIANNSAEQANELNVSGTPTFFLNGNRIEGITWNDIEPALQRAGARQE
ncbi:thioredoxin domain-containing protein [Erythrobacter ani]|uniref:Thioredoxin domain-containing protein n=1 Tax=Erythrobacter ani TaxID=2827235 RepID=A0ABS6SNM7_9SPHN|nr:thioredoxin domain-containing protein [Erythrobacter ani]MBV7266630.1 thioredoxin domain-containing protein [Erythrobacter ani]